MNTLDTPTPNAFTSMRDKIPVRIQVLLFVSIIIIIIIIILLIVKITIHKCPTHPPCILNDCSAKPSPCPVADGTIIEYFTPIAILNIVYKGKVYVLPNETTVKNFGDYSIFKNPRVINTDSSPTEYVEVYKKMKDCMPYVLINDLTRPNSAEELRMMIKHNVNYLGCVKSPPYNLSGLIDIGHLTVYYPEINYPGTLDECAEIAMKFGSRIFTTSNDDNAGITNCYINVYNLPFYDQELNERYGNVYFPTCSVYNMEKEWKNIYQFDKTIVPDTILDTNREKMKVFTDPHKDELIPEIYKHGRI
jgi:hypothetical protein